jgi:hypothetical protein
MRCPCIYLIVTIKKKLTDSITYKSGQTIYIDPNWQPEEFSALEAEVIGAPAKSGYDPDVFSTWAYKGFRADMRAGDKIYMSYAVVCSYVDQPDNDTPIYKNLFMVEGVEYWKCQLGHVFCYIRDGVFHMINGWVMGDIIEDEVPDYGDYKRLPAFGVKMEESIDLWLEGTGRTADSLLTTPPVTKMQKIQRKDKMRVRHIGPNLPHEPKLKAKPGDIVYIDPKYVQEYHINEDAFYIVRQSRIQGYE